MNNVESTASTGLHLYVESTRVQDGSLPIRWCVGKGVIEAFREKGMTKLFILIISYHKEMFCEKRWLVPLEEMMTYIQFFHPGGHDVFASIVWGRNEEEGVELLRKNLLQTRQEFRYVNSLTWLHGGKRVLNMETLEELTSTFRFLPFTREQLSTCEEIEAPAEVFAKKPPEWIWKFANLWHENPPTDQCSFRRRAIFAFTLKWIPVIIAVIFNMVVKSIIAIFWLACGQYKTDLGPLLHPLQIEDCNYIRPEEDERTSVFFPSWKDKDEDKHHLWFLLPFAPVFWVPLLAILKLLLILLPERMLPPIINPLLLTGFIVLSISAILLIPTILICLVITLSYLKFGSVPFLAKIIARVEEIKRKRTKKAQNKKIDRIKQEEEKERKKFEAYYQDIGLTACTGEPVKPWISELPREKRTIYLFYQAVKGKVCKPFPRWY